MSFETEVVKEVNINWQDTPWLQEYKFSCKVPEVAQSGNCDPLGITASWCLVIHQHQDSQKRVSACVTYLHSQ